MSGTSITHVRDERKMSVTSGIAFFSYNCTNMLCMIFADMLVMKLAIIKSSKERSVQFSAVDSFFIVIERLVAN